MLKCLITGSHWRYIQIIVWHSMDVKGDKKKSRWITDACHTRFFFYTMGYAGVSGVNIRFIAFPPPKKYMQVGLNAGWIIRYSLRLS